MTDDWRTHALCRDTRDPRFFQYDKTSRRQIWQKYCSKCETIRQCETYIKTLDNKTDDDKAKPVGRWGRYQYRDQADLGGGTRKRRKKRVTWIPISLPKD